MKKTSGRKKTWTNNNSKTNAQQTRYPGLPIKTNSHALCFCTHPTIIQQRHNAALAMMLSTRKYGGTPATENILYTLCKPGKSGTANNMRIEKLREKNKTKVYCPKQWTKTDKKGIENTNRTDIEEMQAWAVEIANSERRRNNSAIG